VIAALAFCNGTMVFAYRSAAGALRAVTGSFGGAPKWTDQAQISGNPVNDGPSLAVLKNTFYCAYTTHDGSAVIQSSGDGKHSSAPANAPARYMVPRFPLIRAVSNSASFMFSPARRASIQLLVPMALTGANPPSIPTRSVRRLPH
jgi:hypothetical protein